MIEWINATKFLPKDNEDVFVFYKRATDKVEDTFYFGIGWYDTNDTGWHIREGSPKSFPIVIYWLPINQVPFITKFGDNVNETKFLWMNLDTNQIIETHNKLVRQGLLKEPLLDEEYHCTSDCEQEDDNERRIQELESELSQIKKDIQENKLIAAAAFCAAPNPYSFFPPFSMPPTTPLEPCSIQDSIKKYMKSNEQPKGCQPPRPTANALEVGACKSSD